MDQRGIQNSECDKALVDDVVLGVHVDDVNLAVLLAHIDATDLPIWLGPCDCRILAGACDKPVETCISLSTAAEHLIKHNFARKASKEELLERFLPAIGRFNPKFSRNWITKSWLFKTNYAQPVPEINHSHNIPAIQTPINGLYFASMSQVYPWDRGTNYAVEIGRRVAHFVMKQVA